MSLLYLSFSHLHTACSSAVLRSKKGKKNSTETSLQSPFCLLFKELVAIEIGFQTPQSIIQAWLYRKFKWEEQSLQYQTKVQMSEVLSAGKKNRNIKSHIFNLGSFPFPIFGIQYINCAQTLKNIVTNTLPFVPFRQSNKCRHIGFYWSRV